MGGAISLLFAEKSHSLSRPNLGDYDDYDLRPLVPDPLLSFLTIVDASLRVRPISQSLEWRISLLLLVPCQVSCFVTVLMYITCVAI